jgi:tetratricopeptide repeat protein 21B
VYYIFHRISIANADLAVERGDTDQALTLLKTVTEDKPYFIQAKEKMAAIYLTHTKDLKLYIACFKELADKMPGSPTALLLGDAYMNIQEPEQALVVYEQALKKTPRDSLLAVKVGQALVKTHHYTKAISYYEAALKYEGIQFLRTDLAELYLKLRHFDRAEKTIKAALHHKEDIPDVKRLCGDTDMLLLLARVRKKAGKETETLKALEQAREMQSKVLKRISVEQPDAMPEHRKKAADIACQLAKACTEAKDWTSGLQYYREALLHCDTDTTARLALAELLLVSGEAEQSEEECMTLLRAQPTHQGAGMLMADLLFRKGNYEKAVDHYQHLLARKPDFFQALANLIELCRRSGKLADAVPYMQQAESVCRRPASDPGMNYCKGLLKWYENSASEALQLFNQARRDTEWGEKALFNMVDICLNLDSDTIGGETARAVEREASSQEEQMAAIRTAESLLKEVRPKTRDAVVRVQQLENSVLLATKTKANVELALSKFMEMAASLKDNIAVLLGVATAHMILKQIPRARNQLKRIAKMPWNAQEAESFERGWLMLADVYIQAGKYDMALELLKRCLQYNQACCRAWEYLGFISEREQAYRDAATNYEKAWHYGNHANPAVGYRLAFNYLKSKRLVDAIDVCHTVLQRHPHYPKIQREILDKARQGIRA